MIFIHGLEGTSRGVKANLLRGLFPDIAIPYFRGSLAERMTSLERILGDQAGWKIIGSSFGGLMGALYTCDRPKQVDQLVLLAPALIWPDFASRPPVPVPVPTVIYHGKRDELIPLGIVKKLAMNVFTNLDFRAVDDNHGLKKTVHEINWLRLMGV